MDRSLSHAKYAAVIYSDYIRSPEAHIRAHHLMARYFGGFHCAIAN